MKSIPQIQKYMTTTPYSIHSDSSLEEAMKVMKKHQIRHLPVAMGASYGVISDRDLKQALALSAINPKETKVRDICEDAPYVTSPSASMSDVSAELAERKLGSALVMDNGHLVGIFTMTDACKALSEICSARFHA